MSDTRRLALELHEIRQLALGHATNPQFGNSSVDGEGLSFRDGDGNEIGRIGGGENGMEVEYTYGPKPLMPSTPIVTADANLLLVQWDGQWAGGNEDGDAAADPDLASQAGLDRVEVHVSMEPTFVPDPILSFAGVLPVTQEGGAHTVGPLAEAGDYYVVLMARGKDGQYSAPSQRVHVVTTVGLMENELFDLALRADEARESADGKSTVYYGEGPEAPEGGFSEGDLWFDTTEDPETGFRKNTPHLWDPSANSGEGGWVSAADSRVDAIQSAVDDLESDLDAVRESADGKNTITWSPDAASGPGEAGDTWFRTSGNNIIGYWRHSGSAWVSMSLDATVIPNLDAGKITSGFIDSERIKAGSVSAGKLLVGNFTNLVPDPAAQFNITDSWRRWSSESIGTAGAFWRYATTVGGQRGVRAGAGEFFGSSRWLTSTPFQVSPGDRYFIQVTSHTEYLVGGSPQFGLRLGDESNGFMGETPVTVMSSSGRETYTAIVEIPANPDIKQAALRYTIPSTATGGYAYFTDPVVRPAVGATIIEDGAITTEKIAVGAITAESGIIGSLDAGVITTGELRGELIRAQSIAGESLAVDAIDGKTITGATIRTSSAGARVEMDSTGLFVKNSVGANTVSMTNGTLTMLGGTITGGTIRTHTSGARVQLDESGLKAWNPSDEETFSVDANTGMVESRGALYTGAPGTVRAALAPGLFDNVTVTDPSDGSAAPATGAGMLLGDDPARGSQIFHAKSTVFGKEFDSLTILGPSASSAQESIVFARGMISTAAVSASGSMWSQARTQNYGSYMFTRTPSASAEVGASQSRAYLYANTGSTRVASINVGNDNASPKNSIEMEASGRFTWTTNRIYWEDIPNANNGTEVSILSNGSIGKTGSSRRYKIAEEPLERTQPDFYERLLKVQPKTWYDKAEAEYHADVAHSRTLGVGINPDGISDGELRRGVGAIAEDLDEAGLGLLVSYNGDGSPESIMYSRVGIALIPVVKSLRDRVNELERMMGEMANA